MADTTFGYKEVSPATITEMDKRAGVTEINGAVGSWHGARMPWIHVTSLSTGCNAEYKELSSGNFVGTGYESGYKRPKVIVEGVDIKKQGELGTTKKATLKLKAFTDDQVNELAKCFFIPGMSVRIQYGWNLRADGTKVRQLLRGDLFDNDAVAKMIALTDAEACYEGLQGRIVNFTVTYSKEDYWDIVIEVVSAAAALATVPTKNFSMNCSCEDGSEVSPDSTQNQDTPPEQEGVSNLDASLRELIDDSPTIPPSLKKAGLEKEVYRLTYRGYDRDEKGTEDGGGLMGSWAFWGIGDGIGDQTNTFITYRAFEAIVTNAVQNLQTNGKPADFVLDSTGALLSAPNIVLPSESIDIPLFCADPRKAYIPGGGLNLQTYYNHNNPRLNNKPSSAFVETNKIEVSKILINTIFARQLLASLTGEQDNVMNYLSTLWSAINKACGSPWEIAITAAKPRPNQITTLTVADIRGNSNKGQTEYVFKATARSSNVRDLRMDLKQTEAMKTQALYMNQSKPPSTSNSCNSRFYAFATAANIENRGMPSNVVSPPSECTGGAKSKCTDKPKPNSFVEKLDSLKGQAGIGGTGKGVTDQNVSSIVADMIRGISGGDQKAKNCADVVLPIELSITVDGIGGFKFGNGVSCDRLPLLYRTALLHQVTSVEHSISPSDWVTTINTIARLRPKG